jgi:ubiquinone biosynthesis protein Coq4
MAKETMEKNGHVIKKQTQDIVLRAFSSFKTKADIAQP